MNIWGINANNHDAAISVWNNKELKFASQSERYSGVKNEKNLCSGLIKDAEYFGKPDLIVWYESPWRKTIRQLYAGQGLKICENDVKNYLRKYNINSPIITINHHRSHAAGGYYTSNFIDATIIVIDSVGELECLTIWEGRGNCLKKIFSQNYPHSIGIWYSAMTQRCGLKPNEEEYILMGMAAYGDPNRLKENIYSSFFKSINGPEIKFKTNLHKGCPMWRLDLLSKQDTYDIAAATQQIYSELLNGICQWAYKNCKSKNLILMGGCALNCVANSKINSNWNNIWIMPNPGDAGSSLGSVTAYFEEHINWPGVYLGHDLGNRYPIDESLDYLKSKKIVGVATGRAEYGPRALGNRSLLADPREKNIKDKINFLKKREKFRPFGAAILEEHFHRYFILPKGVHSSPYMQFVAKCLEPDKFSSIVHVDGTSRIQTVNKENNLGFYTLLQNWYLETGCPMLLNTSLNIKGMPLVNTLQDAKDFQYKYNVDVFS